MADKRYRYAQTIYLQQVQTAVMDDGGLPERLNFENRITEQGLRLDDGDVAIGMGQRFMSPEYLAMLDIPPMWEAGELLVEVSADSLDEASDAAGPVFDRLLDYLMFEMQAPIRLGQMTVLDVTAPRAVGNEREFATYGSYPFDRYARDVAMGAVTTEAHPTLPSALPELEAPTRAALRWYTKSLEAAFTHDAFMFSWIALESMVDASGVAVKTPYRADCGHEIPNCPTCGKTTERKVRGATLRDFLEGIGVPADNARDLWSLRQMMHGAVPFDSGKLARLAELLQVLRAAVAALLKDALSISPDALPVVRFGVMSIHPAMGVYGTRALQDTDLPDLVAA